MVRQGRGGRLAALGVAAALAGCGTSNAARKEDVEELRAQLRDSRERQAVTERRLADLDARMALLSEKLAARPAAEAPRPSRPALGVVKVVPAAPPPAYAEDDGEAVDLGTLDGGDSPRLAVDRQVLLQPKDVAAGLHQRPDALEAAQEDVVSRTDPKTQYELAMRRYKSKQFSAAARGFEDVADRWPEHPLADNAVYWTGVCYLDQGEFALAINELQKVPVRYPTSDKVPDALLKLAGAYQRVGDKQSAKAMLTQVVEIYPRAEAARPAREELARLNKP